VDFFAELFGMKQFPMSFAEDYRELKGFHLCLVHSWEMLEQDGWLQNIQCQFSVSGGGIICTIAVIAKAFLLPTF
jgi:hypothetical protein